MVAEADLLPLVVDEETAAEEARPAPAGRSRRGLNSLKELLPLVDERTMGSEGGKDGTAVGEIAAAWMKRQPATLRGSGILAGCQQL